MVDNYYRWDFVGLSTDEKPTPEDSELVTDGSTYYCSDTSKLYIWYKDQWYEKSGSGGGATYTAGNGLTLTGTEFSVNTSTIATQDDLTTGLATKQDTLTAGDNITITSGVISATTVTVDSELSSVSTNPVQNAVIYAAIGDIESALNTINNGGNA